MARSQQLTGRKDKMSRDLVNEYPRETTVLSSSSVSSSSEKAGNLYNAIKRQLEKQSQSSSSQSNSKSSQGSNKGSDDGENDGEADAHESKADGEEQEEEDGVDDEADAKSLAKERDMARTSAPPSHDSPEADGEAEADDSVRDVPVLDQQAIAKVIKPLIRTLAETIASRGPNADEHIQQAARDLHEAGVIQAIKVATPQQLGSWKLAQDLHSKTASAITQRADVDPTGAWEPEYLVARVVEVLRALRAASRGDLGVRQTRDASPEDQAAEDVTPSEIYNIIKPFMKEAQSVKGNKTKTSVRAYKAAQQLHEHNVWEKVKKRSRDEIRDPKSTYELHVDISGAFSQEAPLDVPKTTAILLALREAATGEASPTPEEIEDGPAQSEAGSAQGRDDQEDGSETWPEDRPDRAEQQEEPVRDDAGGDEDGSDDPGSPKPASGVEDNQPGLADRLIRILTKVRRIERMQDVQGTTIQIIHDLLIQHTRAEAIDNSNAGGGGKREVAQKQQAIQSAEPGKKVVRKKPSQAEPSGGESDVENRNADPNSLRLNDKAPKALDEEQARCYLERRGLCPKSSRGSRAIPCSEECGRWVHSNCINMNDNWTCKKCGPIAEKNGRPNHQAGYDSSADSDNNDDGGEGGSKPRRSKRNQSIQRGPSQSRPRTTAGSKPKQNKKPAPAAKMIAVPAKRKAAPVTGDEDEDGDPVAGTGEPLKKKQRTGSSAPQTKKASAPASKKRPREEINDDENDDAVSESEGPSKKRKQTTYIGRDKAVSWSAVAGGLIKPAAGKKKDLAASARSDLGGFTADGQLEITKR